jgi:hypothetical protein
MYESKRQAPLHGRQFLLRLGAHLGVALVLVVLSLFIGIAGYREFEGLSPIDALLNSAMLLGGMGPVNIPVTAAGKLFASAYALYAGLVFIVTAALLVTPLVHRFLHHFHWDDDD